MTDNRTTELREKLDKLGIKHLDSDLPYNKQTRWNRGAGGWGACYVEITHGSILPADSIIDNCTLRIYDCTPEQAIAATLGNSRAERTCKFVSSKGSDYPPVCSACGYELGIYDCEWFEDGTYGYGGNYCPNCGARVVE